MVVSIYDEGEMEPKDDGPRNPWDGRSGLIPYKMSSGADYYLAEWGLGINPMPGWPMAKILDHGVSDTRAYSSDDHGKDRVEFLVKNEFGHHHWLEESEDPANYSHLHMPEQYDGGPTDEDMFGLGEVA